MIDGLHAAYGGLAANARKMSSSAHDIARGEAGGHGKSPAAGAEKGLDTTTQAVHLNTEDLSFEPVEESVPAQSSDIDLGKAIIDLMGAQRGFEANAASFKTQDETLGTMLDIMG